MVDAETQVVETTEFTQLDEKLYELQTLFDLSKTLNSSIKNLKTVLDTLLLTTMGKLLISKGLVLLSKESNEFEIETLKGLPRALLNHSIEIDDFPDAPVFINDLNVSPWRSFFKKNEIELLIPIFHDDKELGLIGFGKKTLGKSYADSEFDYLHSLANIAATAIQNGLIFQERNEVNRQLQKRNQEKNTIFEITKEVNSPPLEINKVQNVLAYSIMGEMMVRGCLIFLLHEEKMLLSLNKGFFGTDDCPLLHDENFMKSLLELERPMLVSEGAENKFGPQLQEIKVAALIPMRIQNETKGVIAIGEKINNDNFADDELDFLMTLGNVSINSIENARLFEEEKKKQRLEEELSIASNIQKQLLPEACPNIENFDVAADNNSSLFVGGDYYDCIQIGDDEYIFCIADVSGKGAPAALLMANLQASLHVLAEPGINLTEITSRINNLIYKNTTFDKFITYFIGILNIKTKIFTSVNGGHNPPYIFHKDGTFTTLNEGGLILGMMPNVEYGSETSQLKSGDVLVMFTDGVSEAMNAEDEEFEERRIEECVLSNLELSAEAIMRKLLDAVNEFAAGQPQADDITVQILKVL